MRLSLLVLALAALSSAVAAPARAQTPADRADVRCIMVLGLVRDDKQKEAAARGTFFFLGKVAAHGAASKLQPLMEAEAPKINQATMIQSELTRCGAELQQNTNLVATAYRNLQAAHPPVPPAK